jgi:hypothetical protein
MYDYVARKKLSMTLARSKPKIKALAEFENLYKLKIQKKELDIQEVKN